MTTYEKVREIYDLGGQIIPGQFTVAQLQEVFDAIPKEDKLFEEFVLDAIRAARAVAA